MARTVWAVLVAVGLVLGVSAVGVRATEPAGAGLRGPGYAHPATWLGSYATFGGDPWAWCVDAGRAVPDPAAGWSGREVEAPVLAYLLTRYASDTTPENHAALAWLVHTSGEVPHDPRTAVPATPPVVGGVDLGPRVAALRADAERYAGPYSVRVEVSADPGGTGSVRAVLVSAAGAAVPGWPMTVRLDGPAALADGSRQASATTADGEQEWPLTVAESGTVTATVAVRAPRTVVTLHTADRAGVQRVVTAAPPQEVSGQAVTEVALPFSPRVATRTSAAVAQAGSELTDTLVVDVTGERGWSPGHEVVVTSTLWGPFPRRPGRAAAVPDGAPVVGRVETVVGGPGEYVTPPLVVPGPGYYVWTETIPPDERQTGWTGEFGVEAETTVVPWTPQVSTQASDQSAAVGSVVTDTLHVSGLPDDAGSAEGDDVRMVVTLFGPFAEPPADDDCGDGAPVVARQELTARNGTLVTDGFGPLPAPGWYTFVERIEASERIAAHTGPCGAVAETVHVPAPPAPTPPASPAAPVPPAGLPPAAPPPAPEPPTSLRTLPRTGSATAATAGAGVGLLACGGALLAMARAGGARRPARGRTGAGQLPTGWVPTRPVARW